MTRERMVGSEMAGAIGRGRSPQLSSTPQDRTGRILELARSALGARHGSITVSDGYCRRAGVASSDDQVVRVDRLQHELRDGPCLSVSWRTDVLVVTDLDSDPRWPAWAPCAAGMGVGSLLAIDLAIGSVGAPLTTLALYWTDPTVFTAGMRMHLQGFAAQATTEVAASLATPSPTKAPTAPE